VARPEDALFLQFVRHREPASLAAVFDLVAPDLLRVAKHIAARPDEAEDLVQTTFVTAIEHAHRWQPDRGLFPWLVGICTNHARLRRRATARAPDPARLPHREEPGTDVLAERAELAVAVDRAAAELGDVYRPILALHLQHGLNAKEIGSALGRPAGTVRTQLVRALEHLRRALPAGLGVAAAALLGGRGLAAVREAVLARAEPAVPAAAGGLAPRSGHGLFAGLRFPVAVACVATVLVGAAALGGAFADEVPLPDATHVDAASAQIAKTDVDAGTPAANSYAPERSAAGAAVPAGRGTLTVHLVGGVFQRLAPGFAQASAGPFSPPIPGVRVAIWPGEGTSRTYGPAERCGVTGANGRAVFADLEPGIWQIATGFGDCGALESAERCVVVVGGEPLNVDIGSGMSGTVNGRVVDGNGRPVAGVEVFVGQSIASATPPERLVRHAATTGDDGTFDVMYAAREERVGARRPGYAASWAQSTAGLGDGAVTLVLDEPAATVQGTVVDARGGPVAGAVVGIEPESHGSHRGADGTLLHEPLAALAVTDAAGHFAIAALRAGPHRWRVHAPPRRAAMGTLAVAAGDVATLTAVVVETAPPPAPATVAAPPAIESPPAEDTATPTAPAPGEVTLRVVDELGAPIAMALVVIRPDGNACPYLNSTADDGTVRVEATPGRHQLYIEAPLRLHHERTFALAAGERLALGDVRLEREAALRIRVLRPDGTVWRERPPQPRLLRDGQPLRPDADFECAPDGEAIAVHGLGAGVVTVAAPDGDELCADPVAVTMRLGATVTVDLPTKVGRRCTLEFGDADLRGPQAIHVVVRRRSGEAVAECDAATDFQVGSLRPRCDVVLLLGDYEVSASAPDGSRFAARLAVRLDDRSGRVVAVPRAQ